MKKIIATIAIVLALGLGPAAGLTAAVQSSPDERLLQEAKLLVFDKKWEPALARLRELAEAYPASPYVAQALFYQGECLSSLGGREREALKAYKDYLALPDTNPSLAEECQGSIVDLSYELYGKGDRSAVKDIEARLGHENKVVRYYAAYKLSLVPDKKTASKAVPVLKSIIASEKDPELRDRARIALMRISPESLQSDEGGSPSRGQARMLRLRITKRGQKEPALSINIPVALADLALGAMPEEEKAAIRKEGYDLDKIMNELAKSRESILKIVGDDGSIIEIWIEWMKPAKERKP